MTQLEFLQGSLALVFVVATVILGLKFVFKYFQYRRFELILMAIMLNSHHLWAGAISFVTYIFLGFALSPPIYLFLVYAFMPIGFMCWFYMFYHLVKIKKIVSKTILWYNVVAVVITESLLIYFVITDYMIVGTVAKFDMQTTMIFIIPYISAFLPFLLATYILFFRHCQKSEDQKIQWMGKLIIFGLVFRLFSSMGDAFALNEIDVIIIRTLVIISSFLLYIAWFMPKFVEDWLIKAKREDFENSIGKKDKVKDFLKIVSVRREFTQGEVISYRKQNKCLVCKQKTTLFKYICDCGALYCNRCAKALIQIENMCWVCNIPIDKLKPVIFNEMEEKGVKIDGKEINLKSKKTILNK